MNAPNTSPSFEVHAYMPLANGTRNYGIDGFDRASVLVSGERSAEVAAEIAGAPVALAGARARVAELELALAAARAAQPPKRPIALLGEGCIRQDPRDPQVLWILNQASTGWASFGFRLEGWDDLFRRYDVIVGAPQVDEHGQWWPALPRR